MRDIVKKIHRRHAIEAFIYLLVGGSAWIVQTVIYIMAMKASIFPSVSMILGNLAGVFVAYFGHVWFTFKKEHSFSKSEFIKYFATAMFGLCINVLGVRLITKVLLIDPIYAIIPTILTPGLTFLISKFWAFKSK